MVLLSSVNILMTIILNSLSGKLPISLGLFLFLGFFWFSFVGNIILGVLSLFDFCLFLWLTVSCVGCMCLVALAGQLKPEWDGGEVSQGKVNQGCSGEMVGIGVCMGCGVLRQSFPGPPWRNCWSWRRWCPGWRSRAGVGAGSVHGVPGSPAPRPPW